MLTCRRGSTGCTRAPKCHQPAGTGEVLTLKGCDHCLKAQAGRSSSAPQRLVRAQPPFPCGKLRQKITICCISPTNAACCSVPLLPVPKAPPQRKGSCSLALGHARTPGTQNPKLGVPGGAITTLTAQSPSTDFGMLFQLSLPFYWPKLHCQHRASMLLPKWFFPQLLILPEETEVEWERDKNSDLADGLRCFRQFSSIN